jgi:hypothetical protein
MSYALKGSYRAVGFSAKLGPNWPIRAGIPRSEHSARQLETWKADALPTELVTPARDGSEGNDHDCGRRYEMSLEKRRWAPISAGGGAIQHI